jgi:hypothetical protein
MSRRPFNTVFGEQLDLEIRDAMKYGASLELIYAELSARAREFADAIIAKHKIIEHIKRIEEVA